ncbi:MAG: hypothetical protein DWQ44_04725 [Bacteroidetes bacterium]|nr:MAG: hypothetical protein DWQ33_11065 [Bacteroidota bacterium]REK00628.1 MAG: hypothetical protein DWQ39_10740 [Bacteroidota bacterium]REK35250.1 MAG: hypothetical protein DWQ44_04725 [Bacteroidota bacterium]REK48327.1 MAG: hypothetical protein DWQ48_10925 [Bacteroidota bacterium]
MNKTVAYFLSVVFHPVLIPTYTLYYLLNHNNYFSSTTSPAEKSALYSIILLNTFALPVLLSYLLIRKGWVKSFEMAGREERIVPFITNALLLLVAYFMMRSLMLPQIFNLIILGAAGAVVIAVIINFKWKISIHMIGIGGLVGTFFGLSTFLLVDLRMAILVSLLIAGILGTARLTLGSHTPRQIYFGFFVGFFCEYLVLSI